MKMSYKEKLNSLLEVVNGKWWVECPNCGARFSDAVWNIKSQNYVGDATCPKCGYSAESRKKFKYIKPL